MNRTVIHDDDGLRSREGPHLQEKILDECREQLHIERTLDNCAFNDAVEGDCRKDRISIKMLLAVELSILRLTYHFPLTKCCFLHAQSPSSAQALLRRYVLLSHALVHKYKLLRLVVLAHVKAVLNTKQLVSLGGMFRDLHS